MLNFKIESKLILIIEIAIAIEIVISFYPLYLSLSET